MNLHAIPKEITTPNIDLTWERAIASFQREYNNRYPVTVSVSSGQVYRVQYLQSNHLTDFRPANMNDWVRNGGMWLETDVIQWNLITVVNDESP